MSSGTALDLLLDDFGHDPGRRRWLQGAGALTLPAWLATANAQGTAASAANAVLRVGRDHPVKTLAAAAAQAKPGMTIEVQVGDYPADVAVWPQDDLTLRAVGGRARMLASGAHAQGKGIFVTSGKRMTIEGFDFIGARVPDRNGAGIRLERGSLTLTDGTFAHMPMKRIGQLAGYFSDLIVADGSPVDLRHRHDLSRRSGEKAFIGDIQIMPLQRLFNAGNAQAST